jgi:hypothetical protein
LYDLIQHVFAFHDTKAYKQKEGTRKYLTVLATRLSDGMESRKDATRKIEAVKGQVLESYRQEITNLRKLVRVLKSNPKKSLKLRRNLQT